MLTTCLDSRGVDIKPGDLVTFDQDSPRAHGVVRLGLVIAVKYGQFISSAYVVWNDQRLSTNWSAALRVLQ